MRWAGTLCLGATLLGAAGLGTVVIRMASDDPAATTNARGHEAPRLKTDADATAEASAAVRARNGTESPSHPPAHDAVTALRAALAAGPHVELSSLDALFAAAAEADAESTIALLAALRDTRSTYELHWAARPLLDAIRDDARLLQMWLEAMAKPGAPSTVGERVGADIVRLAEARFVGSAIATLARLDPDAALEQWLRVDTGSFDAIPDETLFVWLTRDPHGTLRRAAALGTHERDRLIREWAKFDPAGAVAYAGTLEDFGSSQPVKHEALVQLALGALRDRAASIDQLFAAAALLPDRDADRVRGSAIGALAESDPDAAAGRLAELGSIGRAIAVPAIARRYAEREPFSALAWAREQGIARGELAVVQTAAAKSAFRALDLALQTSDSIRDEALRVAVVDSLRRDPAGAPDLASRLEVLSLGSERYETAMANLVSTWLRSEPENALAWTMANAARLPDRAVAAAARGAPAGAAERLLDRLPPGARAIWLAESR